MSTTGPSDTTTAEERLQKALSLAFAYLNRRERTVGEVQAHLDRKGISAASSEAALQVLLADGYLDHARYALMYVHDKRELDGWGSERIRRELSARGIDRDLIEDALAQHEAERGDGETELDRALALLRRRFPSPPTERRERDRALGMLIRKGFDGDLALDALNAHSRAA
ncbi:MAG: regulatory protein [Solirubrobacteraceae bacterium]|nr:regulatory protein [Solirubrobacteraceae bacterium]